MGVVQRAAQHVLTPAAVRCRRGTPQQRRWKTYFEQNYAAMGVTGAAGDPSATPPAAMSDGEAAAWLKRRFPKQLRHPRFGLDRHRHSVREVLDAISAVETSGGHVGPATLTALLRVLPLPYRQFCVLYDRLVGDGGVPTPALVAHAMAGYARGGDVENVLRVFKHLRQFRLKCDASHVAVVVQCLSRRGDFPTAVSLYYTCLAPAAGGAREDRLRSRALLDILKAAPSFATAVAFLTTASGDITRRSNAASALHAVLTPHHYAVVVRRAPSHIAAVRFLKLHSTAMAAFCEGAEPDAPPSGGARAPVPRSNPRMRREERLLRREDRERRRRAEAEGRLAGDHQEEDEDGGGGPAGSVGDPTGSERVLAARATAVADAMDSMGDVSWAEDAVGIDYDAAAAPGAVLSREASAVGNAATARLVNTGRVHEHLLAQTEHTPLGWGPQPEFTVPLSVPEVVAAAQASLVAAVGGDAPMPNVDAPSNPQALVQAHGTPARAGDDGYTGPLPVAVRVALLVVLAERDPYAAFHAAWGAALNAPDPAMVDTLLRETAVSYCTATRREVRRRCLSGAAPPPRDPLIASCEALVQHLVRTSAVGADVFAALMHVYAEGRLYEKARRLVAWLWPSDFMLPYEVYAAFTPLVAAAHEAQVIAASRRAAAARRAEHDLRVPAAGAASPAALLDGPTVDRLGNVVTRGARRAGEVPRSRKL